MGIRDELDAINAGFGEAFATQDWERLADFYADDAHAQNASSLAAAWAQAFSSQVESQVVAPSAGGLEPYITVDAAQTTDIPANRFPGLAIYMSAGAMVALALAAFGILFLHSKP